MKLGSDHKTKQHGLADNIATQPSLAGAWAELNTMQKQSTGGSIKDYKFRLIFVVHSIFCFTEGGQNLDIKVRKG